MQRIGIGHDTHRLEAGGPLLLGGVSIPHPKHAVGHSDADVLLHAITDSLLGAASLGDIGEMFPDTDPANRGRSSQEMLRLAFERIRKNGWLVANLDCIVFAEKPKLSPYKTLIQQSIASILQLAPDQVGVKAKTGEGIGLIGGEQIIAAQAVALLQKSTSLNQNCSTLQSSNTPSISGKSMSSVVSADPNQTLAASGTTRLRVYNTLTRTKEPFRTVRPGKVGIYLCGPTVYKEAHIGHMVGPVIFDTIARYLTYCGYEVEWVVNITDVDDKLIHQSQLRGIPMSQVATEMTMDYCANLLELGVDQITHMPKATEHIDEIIKFIGELIGKGFAYQSGNDVFFDVARDREYGKLTNRSADEQKGEGGAAAGRKRSPGDFALWKSAKAGEPSWPSPWGAGRPGWHIECSAMSRRLLGKTFDIHGGGLDLSFPHHENEIAQSECCHGAPMATYWLHNGLMQASAESGKVGGKSDRAQPASAGVEQSTVDTKISRSKGAGGLRRLIAKHTGERIRFFIVRTHYRSTIIFGDEPLSEAGAALDKFYTLFERYQRITGKSYYFDPDPEKETRKLIARREDGTIVPNGNELLEQVAEIRNNFLEKMDDDFNTGGATSDLFQLVSTLNKYVDDKKLEEKKGSEQDLTPFLRSIETLRELSSILGLFRKPVQAAGDGRAMQVLDGLIKMLIEMRAEARVKKDFAAADRIRKQLTDLGVSLEDRKGETLWKI